MKNLILEAESFIRVNGKYKSIFPEEISAPIIAKFTEAFILNDLNLSKEDIKDQAIVFLEEEKLEEVFYCIEDFSDAMVEFTSRFIPNQTKTHSINY